MANISSQLAKTGVKQLSYTEQGRDWLDSSPEFLDLVLQLQNYKDPLAVECAFKQQSAFIGEGRHSTVGEFGGIAIKLATSRTGEQGTKYGPASFENLVHQFVFLSILDEYLSSRAGDTIQVPKQYFAFKMSNGYYLRGEQYLQNDWTLLSHRFATMDWTSGEQQTAADSIKQRIKDLVKSPLLRFGLNDLGLTSKSRLRTDNIFIDSSTDALAEAKFCIVDQPSVNCELVGKLCIALASLPTLNGHHLRYVSSTI